MAKESIVDVKAGHGRSDTERTEFLVLAQEVSRLFTEAPGTTNLVLVSEFEWRQRLLEDRFEQRIVATYNTLSRYSKDGFR